MKTPPKHRSKRWLFWLIFLAALVLILAVVAWLYLHPHDNKKSSTITKPAPTIVSLESNAAFFGDIYWGRYINQWSNESGLGIKYPFSRLGEFDRSKYTEWVANLECPTVAGLNIPPKTEDATLTFNCNPDYLPEAAKWFGIVSLANNHSGNQGADGFAETQKHLEENGIQYFGSYDYTNTTDVCNVVAWPVIVTYSDGSTKNGDVPLALCGYDGVFGIPVADAIDEIKTYSAVVPTIAMPHMGVEYTTTPNNIQRNTYHRMINDGADMVLGNHPHWVQSAESYNGHLIMYSMGNFIFDQQANSEVTRSAVVNVKMSLSDNSDILQKWLEIGKTCGSYDDSCLKQVEQAGLAKPKYNWQIGIMGGDSSNKITKPASAEVTAGILERLGWDYLELDAPYSKM